MAGSVEFNKAIAVWDTGPSETSNGVFYMAEEKRDARSLREPELALRFYKLANDFPAENFDQITKRALGAMGFVKYSSPSFRLECQRQFDLARKT